MLLTTTNHLGDEEIRFFGLVSGEVILGTNFIRDIFASIRDFVGGRSATYERALREGRDTALKEMTDEALALGANGVIGIAIHYETVGKGMLMVVATGTAIRYGDDVNGRRR